MRKIYFAVVLYALSMGGILWLMLAQISASTPPEQTRTKYEIGIFEELTQTYTTPPNYTNYQTGQTFTDTNGYRDNLPVWGEYVVTDGKGLNDALFALRYFPEYANLSGL